MLLVFSGLALCHRTESMLSQLQGQTVRSCQGFDFQGTAD